MLGISTLVSNSLAVEKNDEWDKQQPRLKRNKQARFQAMLLVVLLDKTFILGLVDGFFSLLLTAQSMKCGTKLYALILSAFVSRCTACHG
jgi:hypothetical protein